MHTHTHTHTHTHSCMCARMHMHVNGDNNADSHQRKGEKSQQMKFSSLGVARGCEFKKLPDSTPSHFYSLLCYFGLSDLEKQLLSESHLNIQG